MSAESFTVLITGASRGIGLGLVKQFLALKEVTQLFAGARKPEDAKVDAAVGSAGLNLLINNAGIFIDVPFDQVNRAVYTQTLDVNCTSRVVIAQTFLPLLRRASALHASRPLGIRRAAIINISALLGSTSLNTIGSLLISGRHSLAYRASKAALNVTVKSMSIDLKDDGILMIAQCPGWVQTDAGGPNAFLTVEQSTSGLVRNFFKYGEADNGLFFDHEGNRLQF